MCQTGAGNALLSLSAVHRSSSNSSRKTMFDVWEFRSFEAFNFVCSFTCLIRLRRRTPETLNGKLHNYLRRLARQLGWLPFEAAGPADGWGRGHLSREILIRKFLDTMRTVD